jgi:hypothetical protein
MPVSNATKKAVKKDLLKKEPLMDLPAVKQTLLGWLAQWKRPDRDDNDWTDLVQEFPATAEELEAERGTRMRLAVRLTTKENRYLIAILESLNPESRGVYFVSVHVNWKKAEYRHQEALEKSYAGQFDDMLKAKHNLWVQTFRTEELSDALNSCAVAILGHELMPPPTGEPSGQPLKRDVIPTPQFPEASEE